jgi:hypothetical protein
LRRQPHPACWTEAMKMAHAVTAQIRVSYCRFITMGPGHRTSCTTFSLAGLPDSKSRANPEYARRRSGSDLAGASGQLALLTFCSSSETGFPRSSVRCLLVTLERRGYLRAISVPNGTCWDSNFALWLASSRLAAFPFAGMPSSDEVAGRLQRPDRTPGHPGR